MLVSDSCAQLTRMRTDSAFEDWGRVMEEALLGGIMWSGWKGNRRNWGPMEVRAFCWPRPPILPILVMCSHSPGQNTTYNISNNRHYLELICLYITHCFSTMIRLYNHMKAVSTLTSIVKPQVTDCFFTWSANSDNWTRFGLVSIIIVKICSMRSTDPGILSPILTELKLSGSQQYWKNHSNH